MNLRRYCPGDLSVIERAARLNELSDRVQLHLIDDEFSFRGSGREFDVIRAYGSLVRIPFERARIETLLALTVPKSHGRWIELAYPYRRWLRESQQVFADWEKCTNGERTSWVEWYVEKVRQRLSPAPLRNLLNFEFSAGNYVWLDFKFASDLLYRARFREHVPNYRPNDFGSGTDRAAVGASRRMLQGARFVAPHGLFAPAAATPLNFQN